MDIMGVPINIWHSLVVEEHTGIIMFIIAALVVRVLADIFHSRVKVVDTNLNGIHQAADIIAFYGSFAAVFFLILSGATGYLIQPYAVITAQADLMNKSLMALAALYFWAAFFFMRYWFGPKVWERKGLYLVMVLTAIVGLMFTAFTASIGAEITLGESGFQPLYNFFNFSWATFTFQPLEIGITGAVVLVGILLVLVMKRGAGKKPADTK